MGYAIIAVLGIFVAWIKRKLNKFLPGRCRAKWLTIKDNNGDFVRCRNFSGVNCRYCAYHTQKRNKDTDEYHLLRDFREFEIHGDSKLNSSVLNIVLLYAKYQPIEEKFAWILANEYVLRLQFKERYYRYTDAGHTERLRRLKDNFDEFYEIDEDNEDKIFRIIKKAPKPTEIDEYTPEELEIEEDESGWRTYRRKRL